METQMNTNNANNPENTDEEISGILKWFSDILAQRIQNTGQHEYVYESETKHLNLLVLLSKKAEEQSKTIICLTEKLINLGKKTEIYTIWLMVLTCVLVVLTAGLLIKEFSPCWTSEVIEKHNTESQSHNAISQEQPSQNPIRKDTIQIHKKAP
jgi:hypothetical protein